MKSEALPVVVMIPGDLHLTTAGLPNHKVALWAVDQANEFIRPDFVQFIGDNVQDATDEQFQLFDELTIRLHAPWYALVGDHDGKDDLDATRFRKWIGDPRLDVYPGLSLLEAQHARSQACRAVRVPTAMVPGGSG